MSIKVGELYKLWEQFKERIEMWWWICLDDLRFIEGTSEK